MEKNDSYRLLTEDGAGALALLILAMCMLSDALGWLPR